jgi:NAD(P)H dehydrogenase (quinone)
MFDGKEKTMKIAVTAAGGQLGTSVVNQLLKYADRKEIIGIVRTPEKVKDAEVEIRKGDYNNKSEFVKALRSVDVVLIVSGMDHPDKRIGQHRNIIETAKECGVKKIVYTSIIGKEGDSDFDPIVSSNRQTEKDIMESGLKWSIGRNGLYIEPDIEYLEQYKKDGKISNCAGDGLSSYTTRDELAYAYTRMILEEDRNAGIFNLAGQAISQQQLADYLNKAFGTNLTFESISPDEYREIQKKTNGEFLGTVIAGIYTKIRNDEFNVESDYLAVAGRKHISWDDYFSSL